MRRLEVIHDDVYRKMEKTSYVHYRMQHDEGWRLRK